MSSCYWLAQQITQCMFGPVPQGFFMCCISAGWPGMLNHVKEANLVPAQLMRKTSTELIFKTLCSFKSYSVVSKFVFQLNCKIFCTQQVLLRYVAVVSNCSTLLQVTAQKFMPSVEAICSDVVETEPVVGKVVFGRRGYNVQIVVGWWFLLRGPIPSTPAGIAIG